MVNWVILLRFSSKQIQPIQLHLQNVKKASTYHFVSVLAILVQNLSLAWAFIVLQMCQQMLGLFYSSGNIPDV
jgi:hypothetical protein